ncbi:MAG: helix-turn-helix transcriptional regulator [Oscillospiraceae bacterium]|nr:helix-turn-helix transcriptional regulator [Oscillospiraceae bacterium]
MKERVNRLYELRNGRNLTQSAVAYRLNLSLSRISAYENGEDTL